MNRRHFLAGGAACILAAAAGCSYRPGASASGNPGPALLSAFTDRDGRHHLLAVDNQGRERFRFTVPERCHGGCVRPGHHQAVVFARRPGRHFHVLDPRRGLLLQQVDAGADHHFYGHGVFSRDGRFLYTTANHYPSGDGLVRIYDAHRDYRLHQTLPAGGIGPHELRLHPDGETLVVALGGIRTHPDLDRIKLNLDTMAPALVLLNRHDGRELGRWQPSHHQLSCRHLDVSPEGLVIAGYQYQGPAWHNPPLLARLDTRRREFRELALPDDQQVSLRHYIASVAVSPDRSLALVTAPRGGQALILDTGSGQLRQRLAIADVAGASAGPDGSFLVSSGAGGLFRIRPDSGDVQTLSQQAGHWDNHLTGLA